MYEEKQMGSKQC